MESFIHFVECSWFYLSAVIFYGLYPLLTGLIWAITGLFFYIRRDCRLGSDTGGHQPFVSVLVPAYCEEKIIAQMVRCTLELDYPSFEVIIINDGSHDRTAAEVRPFLSDRRVRLIDKPRNEGKSRALNDGIYEARGELLLIMDADALPDRQLLRYMIPHFRSPKVGAVAGNARVRNKCSVLSKLQAIEFTSIVGLLRRAQRVWGAIMCVSGVVGMFRKSTLLEAGLYSPGMATEDIDLTWKIQMLGYDARYEPRAIVWMIVPSSLKVWWNQRRRWALGLGQVLKRHVRVVGDRKLRRMLPIYIESVLSTCWAITFVVVTTFWLFCYALGHPPRGGSPFPNMWGMILVSVCILQLLCGILIDFRYEPGVLKQAHLIPLYPIAYWMLLSVTTSIYTIKGLCQRLDLEKPTRWNIDHFIDGGHR